MPAPRSGGGGVGTARMILDGSSPHPFVMQAGAAACAWPRGAGRGDSVWLAQQFGVETDLGLQQFGDRAVQLGRLHQMVEGGLVCTRYAGLERQVHAGDREASIG